MATETEYGAKLKIRIEVRHPRSRMNIVESMGKTKYFMKVPIEVVICDRVCQRTMTVLRRHGFRRYSKDDIEIKLNGIDVDLLEINHAAIVKFKAYGHGNYFGD